MLRKQGLFNTLSRAMTTDCKNYIPSIPKILLQNAQHNKFIIVDNMSLQLFSHNASQKAKFVCNVKSNAHADSWPDLFAENRISDLVLRPSLFNVEGKSLYDFKPIVIDPLSLIDFHGRLVIQHHYHLLWERIPEELENASLVVNHTRELLAENVGVVFAAVDVGLLNRLRP